MSDFRHIDIDELRKWVELALSDLPDDDARYVRDAMNTGIHMGEVR